MDSIKIRGARTHNLKNISLDLPRNQLVVITGLSGSGKSSLAFDTLYAEGQRRYVESLSAYARQFLQLMPKPDVDLIEGLSPAIAIEQKATSHNPRSTVGTVTEIHDYLRLLFARAGDPYCPQHDLALQAQSVGQMVDHVLQLPQDTRIMILSPLVIERKGEQLDLFDELRAQGFVRLRINGTVHEMDSLPALPKNKKHTVEVVVDRLKVSLDNKQRLAESFETALRHADGRAVAVEIDSGKEHMFSAKFACPICSYSLPELEPRLFSFNNPMGACPKCDGLGSIDFFDPKRIVAFPQLSLSSGSIKGWDRRNQFYYQMLDSLAKHYNFDLERPFESLPEAVQQTILYGSNNELISFSYLNERGKPALREHAFEGIVNNLERRYRETTSSAVREELAKYLNTCLCPECKGTRLRLEARNVRIADRAIYELSALPLKQALIFFQQVTLPGHKQAIAERIVHEIASRLTFLNNVGLEYLSLDRSAESLSGGESQRIRLASQIGSGLTGVMYVLDEPSIGLHQRDNDRLLGTLKRLRDMGNSVIVVEHDADAIQAADYVVDMGPGAGEHGGLVVAQGTPQEVCANPKSLTGDYLSGRRHIETPTQYLAPNPERILQIQGACGNNLKDLTLSLPVGLLVCVTGVSGSGKSTLARDVLHPNAVRAVAKAQHPRAHAGSGDVFGGCREIRNLGLVGRVLEVDQTPIGKTPRSCPATYVGFWDAVRRLYAESNESRMRGWTASRFSFNTAGGRCEACEGQGVRRIEMSFLPDVKVLCDSCRGARFNPETLSVQWKGKSIGEVLGMSVDEGVEFFAAHTAIHHALRLLQDVGLGYLTLGQQSPTLSGGEAQRIKLVTELSKVRIDALGNAAARPGRGGAQASTLYVLDEPTVGLHMADVEKLTRVLHRLVDAGNTVVVIEHNLDVMAEADWIIDLGPEGGDAGGHLVVQGAPSGILKAASRSHTARVLAEFLLDRTD